MKLGEELRKARLDRKLTPSQVAAATRMKVQVVESIEREDFSSMAAPIYSKGFIKLYAEYVGLDPRPLVDDFIARFVNPRIPEQQVVVEMEPVADKAVPPDMQKSGKPASEAEVDLFSHAARHSMKVPVPADIHAAEAPETPLFPPEVSSRKIATDSQGTSFFETVQRGLIGVWKSLSGWGHDTWNVLIKRSRHQADRIREQGCRFIARFQAQSDPVASGSLMDADVRRPVQRDTRWVVRISMGVGVVMVFAILISLILRQLRHTPVDEKQEQSVATEVFHPLVLPPEPYLD